MKGEVHVFEVNGDILDLQQEADRSSYLTHVGLICSLALCNEYHSVLRLVVSFLKSGSFSIEPIKSPPDRRCLVPQLDSL